MCVCVFVCFVLQHRYASVVLRDNNNLFTGASWDYSVIIVVSIMHVMMGIKSHMCTVHLFVVSHALVHVLNLVCFWT